MTPVYNNTSIASPITQAQDAAVAKIQEFQQQQQVKELPLFDSKRYLPYIDVQPAFVRPDSVSVDPTAGLGNIDKLMAEAEKLLASENPSDQAKGMLKMQKANQMFTLFVELFKMKHQQALSAIQAINAR